MSHPNRAAGHGKPESDAWDAGIRSHSQRAEGESGCDGIGVPATNEAGRRMKWLGLRDDFRNWLIRAA
jgi:hypothetical protein